MKPKWWLAMGMAAAGALTFFGGMVWSVFSGVAVPYQDPTPEMIAYEHFHLRVSVWMLAVGMGLIGAASIYTFGLLLITLGRSEIKRRLCPFS